VPALSRDRPSVVGHHRVRAGGRATGRLRGVSPVRGGRPPSGGRDGPAVRVVAASGALASRSRRPPTTAKRLRPSRATPGRAPVALPGCRIAPHTGHTRTAPWPCLGSRSRPVVPHPRH
jgi:hypothetical protein